MSKLLLDERPLQVQASLAGVLKSLDEAVILQQLHYWLQRSNTVRDNHKWVYNSMADWNKQFPWLSRKALSNHFKKLDLSQQSEIFHRIMFRARVHRYSLESRGHCCQPGGCR